MPEAELELVELPDPAAWELWLEANHAETPGVWLMMAKRGAPRRTVTWSEAVDVAICFGWIDGQKGRIDDHFFRQRFTPRRPRSSWSLLNTERVAALTAAGRMRPAGLAEVQAAQADGRWEAAYSQARGEMPEDLTAAIAADPAAAAFYATISSQNRFAMSFRIGQLKRAETRARRIAEYVEMLARGETLH